MADTKLFNIKGAVKEYQSGTVTLEKELQTVIENNMNIFFGVTFLASEYRTTDGGRMDSIAFGSRIMDASGIHMSPVYNGKIVPFSMQDEYGTVDVYMLPFIKPAHVRRFCDDEITTYTDAINSVILKLSINHGNRNILVTHQFVTGSLRSESEEISVGGSDNVDAYVFDPFDYVALGHIHSPQNCGAEHIRYCGTPLKYRSRDNSCGEKNTAASSKR